MTTVVILCASPWFRATGPAAAVADRSPSFRSSRTRTVSTHCCVATATGTLAPHGAVTAPHGATVRWSRVAGAVQIAARRSLVFLSNRVVTARSAAATAIAQVVPLGMTAVGNTFFVWLKSPHASNKRPFRGAFVYCLNLPVNTYHPFHPYRPCRVHLQPAFLPAPRRPQPRS